MIRWITKTLGTASALDLEVTSDVVALDVRDLVDKAGNSVTVTRERIEQGVELLRQGKRVIVCCDYGISRSNAIAAGIHSGFEGIPLDQAIKEVMHATGEQEIKLEPLRSVRSALEALKTRDIDSGIRILLTGGSGFIGKALVQELSRHYVVFAPTRSELDIASGALALDLFVKEHRINCIAHCANPRVYTSNIALGLTLTLLRNVLDVCRENKVRLIFPSSWEVYTAYRSSNLIADENLPLFPKGPYAETKAVCESLIEHHRKLYDVNCVILRSSPLYGQTSDKPKFIYNFIGSAGKTMPIVTHQYLNGPPKLDLLHISDFVEAVFSAIRNSFSGTLNIGAGRVVSTQEIAEWIVRKTSSLSLITSRNIEDYVANVTMDISLARKVLSWEPIITWEIGLSGLLGISADKKTRVE